jgi:hypothetical protein
VLPAFGLHTPIEAKRRWSAFLMAGLFALVHLIAFAGAILFRARRRASWRRASTIRAPGFADIFATHPSIESRVDALVRYAGGRLPDPATTKAIAQGELGPEPQSMPSGLLRPVAGPWKAAGGQGA